MSKQTILVPDIGSDDPAEIVEVCVAAGDEIEVEQSLIVIETEKASVEVPSSHAGKVLSVLVKEGDQVKQGAAIVEIEVAGAAAEAEAPKAKAEKNSEPKASEPKTEVVAKTTTAEESAVAAQDAEPVKVPVPDLGDDNEVDIIEVCVAVGDAVEEGDSLIVLETEKASMEVPTPQAGTIVEILVKEGQKTKQGKAIVVLKPNAPISKPADSKSTEKAPKVPAKTSSDEKAAPAAPTSKSAAPAASQSKEIAADTGDVYAGPAVRKLARQLGVDLRKISGSGPRARQTKDDIHNYVKQVIANGGTGSGGGALPTIPAVDFTKFGEIKRVKMSKIKRSTAANMVRNWLNVPHVTQFDEADITELEVYRKYQKAEGQKRGIKLTPVPFLVKAIAMALKAEPSFNVSLDPDGEHIIEKQYFHVGLAVDTPIGLMVPVIRDVDQKDLWQIAAEATELAIKAKDGKLLPKDMQGACFTISSLGAMGGTGFTPIVNAPEVGILGVSKAAVKPQWNGTEFLPRTMLPLCLSYDHRAVNGGDAGKFMTYLVSVLQDYEKIILA